MSYLFLEETGKPLKFLSRVLLVIVAVKIVAVKCARREGTMQLKGYKQCWPLSSTTTWNKIVRHAPYLQYYKYVALLRVLLPQVFIFELLDIILRDVFFKEAPIAQW